jgi:hypothetical protein
VDRPSELKINRILQKQQDGWNLAASGNSDILPDGWFAEGGSGDRGGPAGIILVGWAGFSKPSESCSLGRLLLLAFLYWLSKPFFRF